MFPLIEGCESATCFHFSPRFLKRGELEQADSVVLVVIRIKCELAATYREFCHRQLRVGSSRKTCTDCALLLFHKDDDG